MTVDISRVELAVMATRPAEPVINIMSFLQHRQRNMSFILPVTSPLSYCPSLAPRPREYPNYISCHIRPGLPQVPRSLVTPCLRSITRGGTEEREYQRALAVIFNYRHR